MEKALKGGFINESGLEFTDISSEEYRIYTLSNGKVFSVLNPLYHHVSKSGGHRVFTKSGRSFYIQPREGWIIEWKAGPGKPHFVK